MLRKDIRAAFIGLFMALIALPASAAQWAPEPDASLHALVQTLTEDLRQAGIDPAKARAAVAAPGTRPWIIMTGASLKNLPALWQKGIKPNGMVISPQALDAEPNLVTLMNAAGITPIITFDNYLFEVVANSSKPCGAWTRTSLPDAPEKFAAWIADHPQLTSKNWAAVQSTEFNNGCIESDDLDALGSAMKQALPGLWIMNGIGLLADGAQPLPTTLPASTDQFVPWAYPIIHPSTDPRWQAVWKQLLAERHPGQKITLNIKMYTTAGEHMPDWQMAQEAVEWGDFIVTQRVLHPGIMNGACFFLYQTVYSQVDGATLMGLDRMGRIVYEAVRWVQSSVLGKRPVPYPKWYTPPITRGSNRR